MQPQNIPQHFSILHYQACMVLAAVGDAMGYKNGDWQFLTNGKIIHAQMMQLTNDKGPLALEIDMKWRYSDDTVMHIATAEALISVGKNGSIDDTGKAIGRQYKACWKKMSGRAPGQTTGESVKMLQPDGTNWNKIPYRDSAGGCGASMRSACIGLAYWDNIEKLVAISIQSGRMTHHNPVGYLGSVVSSYFTALAIKGVDPKIWLAYFIEEAVPIAEKYIREAEREVQLNLQSGGWKKSVKAFISYCQLRQLSATRSEQKNPCFPENYGVMERQKFYHEIAWGKWPGAVGIDSVLIAYDALLSSNGSWEQLCLRGVLHGGDNDSTGTIAGAWFGAMYGFSGVPQRHYKHLEDSKKLSNLGAKLHKFIAL